MEDFLMFSRFQWKLKMFMQRIIHSLYHFGGEKNQRFTLLYIPHSERGIKNIKFSLYGVYFLLSIGIILLLLIFTLFIKGTVAYVNSKTDLSVIQKQVKIENEKIVKIQNEILAKEYNIKELEVKRIELNSIVSANEFAVNSIFKKQAEINQKNETKNLIYGFLSGVVSSLVATLIIFIIRRKVIVKNSA